MGVGWGRGWGDLLAISSSCFWMRWNSSSTPMSKPIQPEGRKMSRRMCWTMRRWVRTVREVLSRSSSAMVSQFTSRALASRGNSDVAMLVQTWGALPWMKAGRSGTWSGLTYALQKPSARAHSLRIWSSQYWRGDLAAFLRSLSRARLRWVAPTLRGVPASALVCIPSGPEMDIPPRYAARLDAVSAGLWPAASRRRVVVSGPGPGVCLAGAKRGSWKRFSALRGVEMERARDGVFWWPGWALLWGRQFVEVAAADSGLRVLDAPNALAAAGFAPPWYARARARSWESVCICIHRFLLPSSCSCRC